MRLPSKTIQLGSLTIHYTERGTGHPLLLIHGFPETLQGWRHNVPELAKHFRVIALDIIGFGRSDHRDWDFTCRGMAQFIHDFLQKMNISTTHVIGTDTGASIALAFAAEYPESVKKLILFSGTAYPNSISSWEVNLMMMPVLGEIGTVLFGLIVLPYSVRRAFADPKKLDPEALKEYLDCLKSPKSRLLAVKLMRALEKTSNEPLQKLKQKCPPVLILWSENECFFHPWVPKKLNEDLKGSRLEYIADCGHFIQEEQPEIFNEKVLNFLKETS